MSLINDLRDDRANAISTYYSSISEFETKMVEDGDSTYILGEENQWQAKYKSFNDLINLHHQLLRRINGYAVNSSSILGDNEGTIETGHWWAAADVTNARAQLFITDINYAESQSNSFFIVNNLPDANQRHPFMNYNQYNTVLGSFDRRAWRNAASRSEYTVTQNPFATGANYRLAEPLEYYGDTSNLIWGSVVRNGLFHYRNTRLGITNFTTEADTGLHDYNAFNRPLNSLSNDIEQRPTFLERFYNSYWGTGDHTSLGDRNITRTGDNTFRESGNTASDWPMDSWWFLYRGSIWTVFSVVSAAYDEVYNRTNITVANRTGTIPDGNNTTCIRNPRIPEANKLATQGNRLDDLWQWLYAEHQSGFVSRINSIKSAVQNAITNATEIVNFDFTAVEEEAGSSLTKTETQAFIDLLVAWQSNFNSLTGNPTSFSSTDSKWSDDNLLAIRTALEELVGFESGYNGPISGIIGDWLTYSRSALGDYSLGSGELWRPTKINNADNNKGSLGAGNELYVYRYALANKRVNRNDGILFVALGAWKTYHQKTNQIDELEARLGNMTTDRLYDLAPAGIEISRDEESTILIEWDGVKAASSYDIEYKEGLSGPWQVLASEYGYIPPALDPVNYEDTAPSTRYELLAATKGYSSFASFIDQNDPTGLPDNFTSFSLSIKIDGGLEQTVRVRGVDCKAWESLRAALQKEFEEHDVKAEAVITNGSIRIVSDSQGNLSSVEITDGPINGLLATLGTSVVDQVQGTMSLEDGKAYYFRLKTNNGYNTTLGDGTRKQKDWDSHSEYSTTNYRNDKQIHGDIGTLLWLEPEELLVSGFAEDNNLEPSDEKITLTWTSVNNAAGYEIYRSTIEESGYAKIGTSSTTTFEDTDCVPGLEYYYIVRAYTAEDFREFDEEGHLADTIKSDFVSAGVRGKRLWKEITIEASQDSLDAIRLQWSGIDSNGYILYTSTTETGPYSFISNDDATETIFTGNSIVHSTPAFVFLEREFSSPEDQIEDFIAKKRYFFIMLVADGVEVKIKQYGIDSPATGPWTIGQIADQIQEQIDLEHQNVNCELIEMKNPHHHYKLKFSSVPVGENAELKILDGTFGLSLFEILGELSSPTPGGGAFPGFNYYYRVQAVEIADGTIVRRSEMSKPAKGTRPLL